jgi:serine/threonine protein kinase
MNDLISSLNNPNLNTVTSKYIIETGLDLEGEPNPNTQIFVLSPIATNLSEIIRYRRENKWGWSASEFNALSRDLANAVAALHSAKISHNDIRPCNVFYSLERNCYQLACFANAVKLQVGAPGNVRASVCYAAPELATSNQANLEQADVYSLGMTLLSAFYLCEPIDSKVIAEYNNKFESSYPILTVIKDMVMSIDKRPNINAIIKRIPKGENTTKMHDFIQSLKYRNSPKETNLIAAKKELSGGYQRLGLWNDWKD